MVNKRELQKLEMSLHEYFEYIVDSKVNGQHTQAKMMFGNLSDIQKAHFFEYIDALYYYEVDENELVSEMIDFRNYFNQ